MRLTTVILIASLMQVSAAGFAQKISLSKSNASLKTVLREIKTKTGYNFIYRDKVLEKAKPVTINVNHAEVEEVLKQIFENQELSYSIDSKTVIIQPKEPTFLERLADRWAAIDVTGRVVDENGTSLSGATVKVKDGKGSAVTDAQGRFLIENVENGAIIIISYTGYVTREMVAKANVGLIVMKLSENPLDQVQIIAYSTTSRRLNTSSSVTVTSEEIARQPVNNPLLALQGRVPGLQIQQANGIPGGGITVRIQGRNNLNAAITGSDPLYVIDGVPFMSQNLKTFGGGGEAPILGSSTADGIGSAASYGNPLAFINPADIESIDVLKDADATAIYGSRAANGAILITTKKGKMGAMKMDISLQQGWGQVGHKMDLLNSQQYMEMRREAKRNDGASILTADFDLRGVWDTTRYTDWQKELIGGTANYTRLTAGVSGGSSTVQYLISSTYGRETSVFPGNFANTFGSLHFNVTASSTNQRFKIQIGGSYMANRNDLPAEDFTSYALNLPPVSPNLYNPDGTLNWAADPLTGNSTWFNPLGRQYNLFDIKTSNLISNGSIGYQILPGLELKSTFGFTSNTSDQFTGALNQSVKPEDRAGRFRSANFSNNTMKSWIVEPQLNFQRQIGEHRLGILIGSTFQHQSNDGRGFLATGQPSDQLIRDPNSATYTGLFTPDQAVYNYSALFGRISYSWKNKYLLNLTARRDGSSRFGANNLFNNFGAIGAGWILSEEEIIKHNVPFVSFLKLRGSYGTTGNDQIGDYRFMNLYSAYTAGIPYQGQSGLEPTGLSNPNLEWEETRKFQTGIDLGLWKDRLLMTVNYFRNRTSNSLTDIKLPIATGYGSLIGNLNALIQNKGWEFSLNTVNFDLKNFKWNSGINLTIPRNKLLQFPDLENSSLKNVLIIGQPLNTLRYSPFYGVDPQTGLFMLGDQSGNPAVNAVNPGIFVNSGPRWYGGVTNSISFKGISLDFLIQFTKQYSNDVLQLNAPPGRFNVNNAASVQGNQPIGVMRRWQKPGDISIYQRFSSNATISGNNRGNRDIVDASYARLKNVALSYQFSPYLIQKLKLSQLRVFVNAQNLFTVTSYNGLDPETLNVSSLPPLRIVTLGLQVNL